MSKFPHYKQTESKDCGPTCIKIVAKHYGKTIHIQSLCDLAETTREGSSLLGLSEAAEKIGFHTIGVKVNFEKLLEAPLPCIVHWNKNHFAVVYKIKGVKALNRKQQKDIFGGDPIPHGDGQGGGGGGGCVPLGDVCHHARSGESACCSGTTCVTSSGRWGHCD